MKQIEDIQTEKKSKAFSKFVSKFKKTGAPGIFPAYKGMFRKELKRYGSNRANPNLQSLRLRFRLNDHAESDASFKLGINFLGGAKAGIELRGFDRVGSEGIIDLATQWYGEFSSYNTTESPAAYQSPKSVVPAVLM